MLDTHANSDRFTAKTLRKTLQERGIKESFTNDLAIFCVDERLTDEEEKEHSGETEDGDSGKRKNGGSGQNSGNGLSRSKQKKNSKSF